MAKKLLTTVLHPEKSTITGGFTDSELLEINKGLKEENALLKEKVPEYREPESIPIRQMFKELFQISKETLSQITESMKESGFDLSQPLILGIFSDGDALIDGHTRREAAIKAGIEQVPVITMPFNSEHDAIEYAIHLQKDRRNISDAELFKCIRAIDVTNKAGRKKSGPNGPNSAQGRSADRTAALLKTSSNKVKKTRAIEKEGSEEIKEEVESGKRSINSAYTEIKGKDFQKKITIPRLSIPGETILDFLAEIEKESIVDNENALINYGKIEGLHSLAIRVFSEKKLLSKKYCAWGQPLVAAYHKHRNLKIKE